MNVVLTKYQKVTGIIVALLMLAGIGYVTLAPRPAAQQTGVVAIPAQTSSQVEFGTYLPKSVQTKDYILDQTSYVYDGTNKILTYKLHSDDNSLTVTQQSYPDALIFDKLVGAMGPYSDIDTRYGQATLTRPPSIKNGQTAVIKIQATLLFIKSEQDISDATWRTVINALQLNE